MIQISWQEMQTEDHLFNEKFKKAMRDGIFYLGIPEDLKASIPGCLQYAEMLRKNTKLKNYCSATNILGYKKRKNAQIASFTALERDWNQIFPNPILEVANAMQAIAFNVLKITLQELSIPEDAWSDATGQLSDHKGLAYFAILCGVAIYVLKIYFPEEKGTKKVIY